MLSTLYTLAIYMTGVFANDIHGISEFTKSPAVLAVTRAIYYLVPNFHNFNAIATAAHGDPIPFALIWQNSLYAALYILLLLIASSAVFSRRNLK
jgi:ABC-type transport system involved in multi-copper enzyme maturation permease subunit